MKIQKINEQLQKILVTGGYGFIGSAVIRKLLKTTNSEVYNLDKLSSVRIIKAFQI